MRFKRLGRLFSFPNEAIDDDVMYEVIYVVVGSVVGAVGVSVALEGVRSGGKNYAVETIEVGRDAELVDDGCNRFP